MVSALLLFIVVAALAPMATADVQAQGILTQGKSGPTSVPAQVGYLVNFSISVQNPIQPNPGAGAWTGRVYEVPPGADPNDRDNKVGWVELTAAAITLAEGSPAVTYYYNYALTAADVAAGNITNNMAAIGKHDDGTWSNGTGQHNVTLEPHVPPHFNISLYGYGCLAVQFVCTSYDPDGHVVNHTWDFGDGTTQGPISGGASSPIHTYATCGWKTVKVSGYDNQSLYNETVKAVYVACPPKAYASADPRCFEEGGTVITFTGSATTDPNVSGLTITTWSWSFSDCGTATGQVVSRVVTEPITATLTVKDSNGCTDTATVSVGPCTQAPLLSPIGLIALLGALSAVLILGIRRKVR